MLLLGLIGLVPLGVAAFELGRNPGAPNKGVLIAGAVGLVMALSLGILAALIVSAGTFLIGKGTRATGGSQAMYLLAGGGILAVPFLLLGLFYMASLAA